MDKSARVIKNIDYPLLKEQKEGFLKCIDGMPSYLAVNNELLEGLLCLLDELQDAVVEDGIKTEKEVFG
jgi:hypothetical protein